MSERASTAWPRTCSGRHVADGADHEALAVSVESLRQCRGVARIHLGELGEAEVEDLDPPVLGHEEVGGLEVAVDDAPLVGGGEAAGDLLRVIDGLAGRQGPGGEDLAERAALEELGDEVRSAVARSPRRRP